MSKTGRGSTPCGRRSSATHDRRARSSRCRAWPSRERRSRSSASPSCPRERRSLERVHHARRARRAETRAALRSDARRQGSLRHRGRPHDLRVGHLRRARSHADGGGSAAAARRRGGARRQDQSRRVRLGRARGQPVARHVPKSDPARADDRRLLERLGVLPSPPVSATSRSARTPAGRFACRPRRAMSSG